MCTRREKGLLKGGHWHKSKVKVTKWPISLYCMQEGIGKRKHGCKSNGVEYMWPTHLYCVCQGLQREDIIGTNQRWKNQGGKPSLAACSMDY